MSPEAVLSQLMISKVITIQENATVEEALTLIDEKQIRSAPVVDEKGHLLGMFSSHDLIGSLVPMAVNIGALPKLTFAHGAAPQMAEKLRMFFPHPVKDHMDSNIVTVAPGISTWEALRLLAKHKSPLPVIEQKTTTLIGLITEQSAIDALLHLEVEEDDQN